MLLAAMVMAALAACKSHEPTGPSAMGRQVSGTWSGRVNLPSTGLYGAEFVFSQSRSSVNATWRVPNLNWTGTAAGTLNAQGAFNGTLSINAPTVPQNPFFPATPCSDTGTVREFYPPFDPTFMTLGVELSGACRQLSGLLFEVNSTCRLVLLEGGVWGNSCQ